MVFAYVTSLAQSKISFHVDEVFSYMVWETTATTMLLNSFAVFSLVLRDKLHQAGSLRRCLPFYSKSYGSCLLSSFDSISQWCDNLRGFIFQGSTLTLIGTRTIQLMSSLRPHYSASICLWTFHFPSSCVWWSRFSVTELFRRLTDETMWSSDHFRLLPSTTSRRPW